MLSRVASRLPGKTNPLYTLLEELKRDGRPVADLVSGNVNDHSLRFPQSLLEEILTEASRRSQVYRPQSLGQGDAREAVARYYASQGIECPASQVLVTPGTSISYWYCFKLLADAGEEILCPRPSYPLFDYIAALSDVRLVSYPLIESQEWRIDTEALENTISTRTRAIVLISPHNPTGRVADAEEIARLAQVASRHDLAIISDEVFSEFLLRPGTLPRPASSGAPLVLTLNGFSKMFALPGLKFGWAALSGETSRVRAAMNSLELISDTFLPVNEIVQAAAPAIFERGRGFLQDYTAEICARLSVALEIFANRPGCAFVPPGGGFHLTLRLERGDEEQAALGLLREKRILVHPGHFYDMDPHHLVLSCIAEPEVLRKALAEIAELIGAQA